MNPSVAQLMGVTGAGLLHQVTKDWVVTVLVWWRRSQIFCYTALSVGYSTLVQQWKTITITFNIFRILCTGLADTATLSTWLFRILLEAEKLWRRGEYIKHSDCSSLPLSEWIEKYSPQAQFKPWSWSATKPIHGDEPEK